MNCWCSYLFTLPFYVFQAELIRVGGEEGESKEDREGRRTECQISETERISEKRVMYI